jgi:hypothetical protein
MHFGRKPTATSARSVLTPTRKATAGPMLSAAFTRADTGKKLGGGARRGEGEGRSGHDFEDAGKRPPIGPRNHTVKNR